MTGRLIAVVGPSGVGKDTLIAELVARRPSLHRVRRCVTRPADAAGGEPIERLSEAEFARRQDAGAFLLHWRAHGLCYGVPSGVLDVLARGRHAIVNLSRGALSEARSKVPQLVVLALSADPPVLAARLAARGRERAQDIASRLDRGAMPLPDGVSVIAIDNSGTVQAAADAALAALYPESAWR